MKTHLSHCASGGQGWPPPSAATALAARGVLDGREHGGTLGVSGLIFPVPLPAFSTGCGKRK